MKSEPDIPCFRSWIWNENTTTSAPDPPSAKPTYMNILSDIAPDGVHSSYFENGFLLRLESILQHKKCLPTFISLCHALLLRFRLRTSNGSSGFPFSFIQTLTEDRS